MSIHAPIWKPEITAGNLVSWLLAIFVAGGAVFVLKYQVDELRKTNDMLQIRVDKYQGEVTQRISSFEQQAATKISALESSIADGRVGAAEVRGSISAIERDIANIARNIEQLQRADRRSEIPRLDGGAAMNDPPR